ncbi:hypothetical protein ARMSODRAFT_982021 [Armillaria solidipes]|uniref:Uncharacterized protein n=1 Tax=Armillaria solidipes TaxID=1076256 RepID=A0A2H3AT78_9AGAR|nr:hypothetical protein ARMSODRAFT_982021 [Armillaria solidipes]
MDSYWLFEPAILDFTALHIDSYSSHPSRKKHSERSGMGVHKDLLEPAVLDRGRLERTAESLRAKLTQWCGDLPSMFKRDPRLQSNLRWLQCSGNYFSVLTALHSNLLSVNREDPSMEKPLQRKLSKKPKQPLLELKLGKGLGVALENAKELLVELIATAIDAVAY